MTTSSSPDPAEPALGEMLVLGGTVEGYVDGASRTRIDQVPVDGMVLHWSAELPDGMSTGTLWRSRGQAERFLVEVLAETFTEIAGAEEQFVLPRPDYSYELSSLREFEPGADADLTVDRRLGEAAGAVLVRPRGEARELIITDPPPEGVVAHLVAAGGWTDLWLDRGALQGVYEADGTDLDALEIFPLHTLFVNAGELDQFPRFPRRG
jgi:hypothetical protein